MFNSTYNFFGHELVCLYLGTNSCFRLEKHSYTYIKKMFNTWKFHRIETDNQDGFPDILMFKQDRYLLIEAKRLKKKKLNKLEDDLTWQFGQLGFAKRAFTKNLSYIIVVVKDNQIAFIGDKPCLEAYL